jgi:hypothetical protein
VRWVSHRFALHSVIEGNDIHVMLADSVYSVALPLFLSMYDWMSILSVFYQRVRWLHYAAAIPYSLLALPLVVVGIHNWQMIVENPRW